jgi:hypothetical protein
MGVALAIALAAHPALRLLALARQWSRFVHQ